MIGPVLWYFLSLSKIDHEREENGKFSRIKIIFHVKIN